MPGLIDLSYHFNQHNSLMDSIHAYKTSYGYIEYLRPYISVQVIQHAANDDELTEDGVQFTCFRSKAGFLNNPSKTHQYIRSQKPDVVLVQGLRYPWQVMRLRRAIGNVPKVIVQHHGELPGRGIMKFFQKLADNYIDGYLFTSLGNAKAWIKQDIVSNADKCFEVLEASTFFKQQHKAISKKKLGMDGEPNFLWVGRLNANKDPITAFNAFREYYKINENARLYMIYHEADMLEEVQQSIGRNKLEDIVYLVGKVEHETLQEWFSAADYYLSASYNEGSGYALIEAMACGCIPIVTDIPSFRTITGEGKCGMLYKPGDANGLLEILKNLDRKNRDPLSTNVLAHFDQHLSFKAIAEAMLKAIQKLS